MPTPAAAPWWKHTVVYQIYPRSFADADGDGIGDLAGVESRLDHLADLGVETLWISPFFQSPQRDFGYDVSDYRVLAPEYGDMAACKRLFDAIHARGMKVVLDLVLNHTSDQHPWFVESRASTDNPKRDWYIWRPGRGRDGRRPPTNWRAMIGGSGWHRDDATGQWYWAQFLPFQPDLNYRNPAVKAEMLDTLRFWLGLGADGFRLDIVNALFEDEHFRDNPFRWTLLPSDDDPTMLFRGSDHTLNHPDTRAFMRDLRAVMDEFGDPARFLVGEVNAPVDLARAHCGAHADGLHLVFLFRSLTTKLRAPAMRAWMAEVEAHFPDPFWPTWVFGNHDRARRISRLADSLAQAKLNALWQLTARGVPFLYYGEEIGMPQARLDVHRSQDAIVHRMRWLPAWGFAAIRAWTGESLNRDECRTPMQWDAGPNAGFCPAGVAPWLPTSADTGGRSVAEQAADPDSLLATYKRLLRARRAEPALHGGSCELLPESATGRHVLGYRRVAGDGTLVALLNASDRPRTLPNPAPGATFVVGTERAHADAGAPTLTLAAWEGFVLRAPRA